MRDTRNNKNSFEKIVAIGGSAGAFMPVQQIIRSLVYPIPFPLIVILHRLKNVDSDFSTIMSSANSEINICEPDDKTPIKANHIYIVPPDYHLLVANDMIMLDYSELVYYSRPSIDVTFQSLALAYREKVTGIVLSGANGDGAKGLESILSNAGKAIVQHTEEAAYREMPHKALERVPNSSVMTVSEIITYLNNIKF